MLACGNNGFAALDALVEPVEGYALEVSSYQLAHSQRLSFSAGMILNLAPDHQGWHGSMQAYQAAKCRLFKAAPKVLCEGRSFSRVTGE